MRLPQGQRSGHGHSRPDLLHRYAIIVEDSESTAKLNEMIHDYAEYVVGRMGIPYREKNISIISLVIDAPQTKISELSGKIGRLSGVTAKAAYAKV